MKFSIAILAGGTSKRMGTDKALLPFKSATLLGHLTTFCQKYTDDLMICSNNLNHKIEGTFLIPDIVDNIGPLGGLIPAIEKSKYETTLVVSCDMPFIDSSFINAITEQLRTSSKKCIIPVSEGQPQYLCAAYNKSILKIWKTQVSSNNYSVKHNLSKANCSFVHMDFLDTNIFKNINNLKDYQSIL